MNILKTLLRKLGRMVLWLSAMSLSLAFSAYLIVPHFVRERCQGALTACKSNLNIIGIGLEMYATDWAGRYPRNLNQLTPMYLKRLPECPSAGRMSYRADFGLQAHGNTEKFDDYYFIECTGDQHTAVGLPPDYPQYTSLLGLIDQPTQKE